MKKLVFEGWNVGMKKIPFIMLLKEHGGITLSEAKDIKDRLVDNDETIEMCIADDKTAQYILEQSITLGVKSRIKDC